MSCELEHAACCHQAMSIGSRTIHSVPRLLFGRVKSISRPTQAPPCSLCMMFSPSTECCQACLVYTYTIYDGCWQLHGSNLFPSPVVI